MDKFSGKRSKKGKVDFLNQITNNANLSLSNIEFTTDELTDYVNGKTESSVTQRIDNARLADSDLDQEIKLLQHELSLVVPIQLKNQAPQTIWKLSTLGLGVAACGLAGVLILQQQQGPTQIAELNNGLTKIIRVGNKTFSQSELSAQAIAALSSGSIEATVAWRSVAPIGDMKPRNEISVDSPMNTSLVATPYILTFSAPPDLESLTLFVRSNKTERFEDVSSPFSLNLSPGTYSIELRGISPDKIISASQFKLRVLTSEEEDAYNKELSLASNPIDRLIVYAKYGMTHEFENLKMELGDNAPQVILPRGSVTIDGE